MNYIPTLGGSSLSLTDMFCGAGGSSTGASHAGIDVRLAMNHWQLALDSHESNHPKTHHVRADISESNPRHYPTTDILWSSPECTNHSVAKGNRKVKTTQDLFEVTKEDPAAVRSRATMWDVVRFAEHHKYNYIIVENVVDVRTWVLWDAWLLAMHRLGYSVRPEYINSMFLLPTPQSRDRIYIVCTRKGMPIPDTTLKPAAYCGKCCKDIRAIQSWKKSKKYGKYGSIESKRGQYTYCCPLCASEVIPYYFSAINAIDWTIEAPKIGEREKYGKQPLKPRTIERVKYGIKKFSRQPLAVSLAHGSNNAHRSRPALSQAIQAQTTAQTVALVSPGAFIQKNYGGNKTALDLDAPFGTVTSSDSHSLITCPLIINRRHNLGMRTNNAASSPVPTQTTEQNFGVAYPSPFIAELYGTSMARPLSKPLGTVTAGGTNHALISRKAFLSYYYKTHNASGMNEPVRTLTTKGRVALSQANGSEDDVNEWTFRMLDVHELQAVQYFPKEYVILGTKKERVKQIGNAVSPKAAEFLIGCIKEALSDETH